MPIYHRQTLDQSAGVSPAIEPLTGGHAAIQSPAVAVHRAQDRLVSNNRRIVLQLGLAGELEWRAPNVNPNDNSRIYPDRTTWYEIARTRSEVTPGCALKTLIQVLPSGATQRAATAGEGAPAWRGDGNYGRIRITVTWRDRASGSETQVYTITTPGSTNQYGAEGTDAGAMFRDVRTLPEVTMRPPGWPSDLAEVARFCKYVTCDVVVSVQGSPRIVDLVVYEYPDVFAIEEDADPEFWTQGVYADGSPSSPVTPPVHAHYEFSDDDPRRGTHQVLVTAAAQHLLFNPILFDWHCYTEGTATPTSTKAPRTTANDGATYESILSPTITSYSATHAGFSVSCGGYARDWASAGYFVLLDRIAVVPVLVRVYGRTITAGTGTVRVQTAAHSYVDVNVPVSSSNAWSTAYGWLEVGINPEQHSNAQVMFNHLGASGSLSIEDLIVCVNRYPGTV